MPDRTDWTAAEENDVLVIAYLYMLARELRDEPYVKARTNEALQRRLGRSKGSVEFKLANVSAVLHEMHHPWVEGYKPRPNFQESLRAAVLRHAPDSVSVAEAALAGAADPVTRSGSRSRPPGSASRGRCSCLATKLP